MKKLQGKQQKFVDEYIKDLNATQAAIRAGYSKKTANRIASQNLSKVVIQLAIQAKQQELAAEDKIDALYIKEQAHYLFLQCAGKEPINKLVSTDSGYRSIEALEFNGPAANKALETLGKHVDIQAFKESVGISGTLDVRNDWHIHPTSSKTGE